MAMYHMVGVTPEAPSVEAALGGNQPNDELIISDRDIQSVFENYNTADGNCSLVVFSGPQQSIYELKYIAELLKGKKVHPNTQLFVTTNAEFKNLADKLGISEAIEEAGGIILEGVCFYLLQNLTHIRETNNWKNLVSNSAKLVNTITAHRFNTILRSTADCVEAAVSGKVT